MDTYQIFVGLKPGVRDNQLVDARDEPIEGAHYGINSLVQNFQAALYRDYPDAHRQHGEERF